jgi:hypothetical protein
MKLTLVDGMVILAYFAFNLGIGFYYRKRATKSVSDFFVSGRKVTWWLAGTSMVATTFAADTPLAVTRLVARNGISGNWIWWSMAASGILTVFFYTVALTTAVWLAVTFMTKPEPKDILLGFYRRVRPSAALWGPIAKEATDIEPRKDGLFNLMDWLCGVLMIYAFLFGAGKIIFGELGLALAFLSAGFVFGGVIYADLSKRGWETVGQ